MADEKPDMGNLQIDLENAIERHRAAAQRTSFARNEECDALNALNAAQKAFDAGVEAMHKAAHYDSDWGRTKARSDA
jgi:hypothetical protein